MSLFVIVKLEIHINNGYLVIICFINDYFDEEGNKQ